MTILNKEKILEVARAFVEDGKLDRAIREYEKIILADPTDLRVKLRVAELHTKRKEISEAIRLYREVADAYEAEGFFLKAVTVSKSILRLNPSLIEVNECLAHLYEKMGLTNDAVRQYGILASSLDAKGMTEKVIEVRSKIVGLIPEDLTSRVRLAEIYQREGRMEEAIDQYEKLAIQLEKSGKNKSKLADLLEKILSHRPEDRDKIVKLIDLYLELGENKKAIKWLEAAGELVERNPRLLKLSADLYSAQNQNETARIRYMKLVDLAIETKDIDLALEAYLNVFMLYPDEEERLGPQIEQLRPGATKEISEKAQKMREERETSSALPDEDTAEEGDAAKEPSLKDVISGSDEKPKTQIETQPPSENVLPVQKSEPEDITDRFDTQKADLPKKVLVNAALVIKSADASFNLANAYEKMGLVDEARVEFKKARKSYVSIMTNDSYGLTAKKRISEIDIKLGIKPQVAAKEKMPEAPELVLKSVAPVSARKVPVPTKSVEKNEKKDDDKAQKTARSAKKISFV
jgi:tetratricopeptide (TPR) repeat protein